MSQRLQFEIRPDYPLKRLRPGFYEASNGALHISIPELLTVLDVPDTPTNRKRITSQMAALVGEMLPKARCGVV